MGGVLWSSVSCPAELREKAVDGFKRAYTPAGDGAEEARATVLGVAPGRAEVVGNHTDYNEGLVLACAIDRYVVIAGRPAPEGSRKCRLVSESFPDDRVEVELPALVEGQTPDLSSLKQTGKKAWANYVLGVVDELAKAGAPIATGFDVFVTSDVPPGAGVSSSAALEMATCKFLERLFPSTVGSLGDLGLVKAAKAAENNFVGMGCGILDQYCSGLGQAGSLVYLDCRTISHEYVPFSGAQFVLANTNAPHALVDGQYDKLRANCFSAADELKKAMKSDMTHLRDVSVDALNEHKGALTPDQLRHAEHIVNENARVMVGVQACREGNMEALGTALSESHASSRDQFRNSSKELDVMQRCAQGIEGHYGSRLMGGGFGGSTINLVQEGKVESFIEELKKRYEKETGIAPTIWACSPGSGAFYEDA